MQCGVAVGFILKLIPFLSLSLSLYLCVCVFQNATGRLWALVMARATGPSHRHSWRTSRVTCVSVYSPLSPRRGNASFSLSACSIFAARLQSKSQFSLILLWSNLCIAFVIKHTLCPSNPIIYCDSHWCALLWSVSPLLLWPFRLRFSLIALPH